MKQYRSWLMIVGLAGLGGTHCTAEQSDGSSSTSTADAVAQYEQALAGAPVSLAQAIANAKAKHPEGTLEDARFVAEGVSPVFEVDLSVGTTVLEGRIDPASGEVQSWGPDDDAEATEGEDGEAPEGGERVPCDQPTVLVGFDSAPATSLFRGGALPRVPSSTSSLPYLASQSSISWMLA